MWRIETHTSRLRLHLPTSNGIRVFSGTINGRIVTIPRGREGFGYDPIFEFEGRTLAEFPIGEKNRISHRALALTAFRDWFMREYTP